nr:MAG TPA: hypothetical protein [Caudoviricetes sp.]
MTLSSLCLKHELFLACGAAPLPVPGGTLFLCPYRAAGKS